MLWSIKIYVKLQKIVLHYIEAFKFLCKWFVPWKDFKKLNGYFIYGDATSWWRNEMETLLALLALCEGNRFVWDTKERSIAGTSAWIINRTTELVGFFFRTRTKQDLRWNVKKPSATLDP